jgi:uncharacterized membrane protein
MNTLVVWRFDDPGGAAAALPRLEKLARAGEATVDDAALVTWPRGRRKPSTANLGGLSGPGRLWGGSWGVLMALIFLAPIAGPTFGAAAGAVAGSLSEFGIADDFVKRVREQVGPGSSALFVVTTQASAERLGRALRGLATTTTRSALSPTEEQHLRDALGEEREPGPAGPATSGAAPG